MKKYGTEKPPLYPLDKVKNLPIVMVCGKTDRLCQPGDYNWLKDILKENNSLLGFIDTEYGHLSIIHPNLSVNKSKTSENNNEELIKETMKELEIALPEEIDHI